MSSVQMANAKQCQRSSIKVLRHHLSGRFGLFAGGSKGQGSEWFDTLSPWRHGKRTRLAPHTVSPSDLWERQFAGRRDRFQVFQTSKSPFQTGLNSQKKSTRHRFALSSTKTSNTPPQWLHSPCILNIFKRKFKARLESWNWENIEEEKGHTFVKWKWYQENLDSWVELISFIDWRFQFQTRRTVSKHHWLPISGQCSIWPA